MQRAQAKFRNLPTSRRILQGESNILFMHAHFKERKDLKNEVLVQGSSTSSRRIFNFTSKLRGAIIFFIYEGKSYKMNRNEWKLNPFCRGRVLVDPSSRNRESRREKECVRRNGTAN